jgi:hypothetical protein
MNKSITHSYKGMLQDLNKSSFNNEYYFEGKNIRILATDSQTSGNITNEKGNDLILTIPNPVINYSLKTITYNNKVLNFNNNEILNLSPNQSGDQKIIGHGITKDYVIIISTDNNGFDCVWKINRNNYDITLIYLRNLELSENYPIQIINNFENQNIDKIYWVDNKNQMRFLNINHSVENKDLEDLIDIPQTIINMVGEFNLTQPYIYQILNGGTHTSGMIQYAYNLYRLNSSQTKLTPFSELISLDNNLLGGGNVNEIVSTLPVLKIDNIDNNYTNIKVYSIKYTSINEVPVISLIEDRSIPSTKTIEVYDDGTSISKLSLEEFLFLGSDIIIPSHINSKDNRLFLANYKEINFEVNLDTRAYSFNDSSESVVYNGLSLDNTNNIIWENSRNITNQFTNNNEDKFDSINLDYDNYKFQYNGLTYGGEGKYLKYELIQTTEYNPDSKYFKDNEIYRLGIQFYNKFGQNSLPKWVSDFKSREGNLEGNYNILKFELKPDFFTWLNTNNFTNEYDIPIGYRILIAERTSLDRTIVANGILSTMMINDKSTKNVDYNKSEDVDYVKTKSDELLKLPNVLLRNTNESSLYGATQPLKKTEHLSTMSNAFENSNTEFPKSYITPSNNSAPDTTGRLYQYNTMMQIYSPEILFNTSLSLTDGLSFKVKGSYKNTYNANWAKKYKPSDGTLIDEVKSYNGIITPYSSNIKKILGNPNLPFQYGIVSHPSGRDANKVVHSQFYRGYGKINITDSYFENNKIIKIQNDISLIPTFTDEDGYINQIAANRGVSIELFNGTSVISYTITPDVPYLTTPYTLKITSDIEGNVDVVEQNNVIGINTITRTQNNMAPVSQNREYYLLIDTVDGFSGTIDLNIETDGNYHTEYESLNNIFIINNTTPLNPSESFNKVNNDLIFDIYGKPEVTEKGQDSVLYNGDNVYRYTNTLTSILTDGDSTWDDDGKFGRRIVSINSDNNRCITLVLGDNDKTTPSLTRPTINTDFLLEHGLSGNDNALIVELIKNRNDIYLGNIYGGNTFEDKQRTNYIEIGDYKKINILDNVNVILSPGDTFVNNFRFLRIIRKEEDVMQEGTYQYEEIIEYPTETSIDLKNRKDLSLNIWDSKFNPKDKDYHNYNKVYSQNSNLLKRRNIDYNVKKVNNFNTNIISSKLKSSGELIDSWTDIQLNEIITIDGKYGSINSLVSYNDELYSIQDTGFAFLSINPRVQVQGADGLALELGTGSVLQDYKYISTKSGTLNKWGVVSTTQGIYYFDLLNKSIQLFKGGILNLSDSGNLHTYFINNIDFNLLKLDNPILKRGVSSTYDFINKDILFSFHQNEKSFTISYNELTQSFISFYDYIPSFYISYADSLITTDVQNKKLFKHFIGDYNKFYNNYYSSSVTLNVNPEPNKDCVFDNINFKSDVTLNNVDQPDITLTHIQAYNDYQNSGLIPLTLGRNNNLRRKFRDWNASIPRQNRNRIRAPYIKLKLQFDNTNNYKLILHNLNVFYTTY